MLTSAVPLLYVLWVFWNIAVVLRSCCFNKLLHIGPDYGKRKIFSKRLHFHARQVAFSGIFSCQGKCHFRWPGFYLAPWMIYHKSFTLAHWLFSYYLFICFLQLTELLPICQYLYGNLIYRAECTAVGEITVTP